MNEIVKQKLTDYLDNNDYENFILLITNLSIDDSNYESVLNSIGNILSNKKFNTGISPSNSKKELEKLINGEEDNYLNMHQNLKEVIVKIFKIKLNTNFSRTFKDDERNDLINNTLDNFEGDFNI